MLHQSHVRPVLVQFQTIFLTSKRINRACLQDVAETVDVTEALKRSFCEVDTDDEPQLRANLRHVFNLSESGARSGSVFRSEFDKTRSASAGADGRNSTPAVNYTTTTTTAAHYAE